MRILDKAESIELGLANRLYPELLAPSFSPEQLGEPWQDGHLPADLLLVAWDESSGDALGCAVGETYPTSETLLLGYLAVKRGSRSHGIGSALMHAVQDRWCTEDTFALAEIDDPRHHQADAGYGDPWARVRFYERFNLKALATPYFQPSLGRGYPRAYHVMLCRLSPSEEALSDRSVSGDRVQSFLREYFTSCEGESSLEDPEVRWLLDHFNHDVDLVPLADLERIPDPEPLSDVGQGRT
jgi:GNAT superfamily N-acetyltransferase